MKIAIVTGASSGIGASYACWDEICVIARNETALWTMKKQCVVPLCIFAMDITQTENLLKLEEELERVKPYVKYFVNAAGCGINKKVKETELMECNRMLEVNCNALTLITKIVLPYCGRRSRIVMLASASAFLPQPGFAVYAASKSYVLSFSRALRRELKKTGTTVTIVCPGPVDTPFLDTIGGKDKIPLIKRPFIMKTDKVVSVAMKDAAKGKELSIPGISMKCFFRLCKAVPHKILLKFI